MSHYAVYVIPDANKDPANKLFALLNGDPPDAQNLGQGYSADGSAPATHWLGGRPVDETWLGTFQGLATSLPVPDGGWPSEDYDLTEADAQAAAAALYLNVNTGEDAESLPAQNIATVCAALGIQKIVEES